MTTQVRPLVPMVNRVNCEALLEMYQRFDELDYALCAGNTAEEPIPHDVLAAWILYVRTGKTPLDDSGGEQWPGLRLDLNQK